MVSGFAACKNLSIDMARLTGFAPGFNKRKIWAYPFSNVDGSAQSFPLRLAAAARVWIDKKTSERISMLAGRLGKMPVIS